MRPLPALLSVAAACSLAGCGTSSTGPDLNTSAARDRAFVQAAQKTQQALVRVAAAQEVIYRRYGAFTRRYSDLTAVDVQLRPMADTDDQTAGPFRIRTQLGGQAYVAEVEVTNGSRFGQHAKAGTFTVVRDPRGPVHFTCIVRHDLARRAGCTGTTDRQTWRPGQRRAETRTGPGVLQPPTQAVPVPAP